jgi:hypothetical protein
MDAGSSRRLGVARTGKVVAFSPDGEPNPDKGATVKEQGVVRRRKAR